MEKILSIRGATTVNENSVKEIKTSVIQLINEIFKQNKIDKSNIINIIFTVTNDLDLINPATVVREEFELDIVPMLCVQEMKVKNGLPKCIRVMIQITATQTKNEVKHVYLGDAANLRPDLSFDV